MSDDVRKVVLASRNLDKVRELKQLMDGLPFDVVSAADYDGLPEVIEDGTTIMGNASRKAIVTAAFTGEISVADDTALQVRELNGMPDIFAARFAGVDATYADNAQLLIDLMADVPAGYRQARFETACAWVDPRPQVGDHPVTAADQLPVTAPGHGRWLRNPFARAIHIQDPKEEWDFWNGLIDRRAEWAHYRRQVQTDLVSNGHNNSKLNDVIRRLLDGCVDAVPEGKSTGPAEKGLRIPDPRIWAVDGPETTAAPLTDITPTGLPAEAPGRSTNGPFWLEIAAVGRVLGEITGQPVGSQGFGYDPVFRPVGEQRTLAEMPPAEKNAISHRGRAMRRLMVAVRNAYGVEA